MDKERGGINARRKVVNKCKEGSGIKARKEMV